MRKLVSIEENTYSSRGGQGEGKCTVGVQKDKVRTHLAIEEDKVWPYLGKEKDKFRTHLGIEEDKVRTLF